MDGRAAPQPRKAPQLEHPVHDLTEDERDAGRLTRFEGLEVPVDALLGLVRRGWERGAPMEAGIEHWISRRVTDGLHLVVSLDPGMNIGMLDTSGAQTLVDVRLAEHPYSHRSDQPTTSRFGDLPPIVASELLDDLTHLASAAEESRGELKHAAMRPRRVRWAGRRV